MRLLDRIDRQLVHNSLPRIAPRAPAAMALAMGLLHAPAGAKAQGVAPPPAAASAPDPSWVHESWTVKDGLPVNSINAVIQDRTGYIWATTFDGWCASTGVRFTVFNTANSEDLPSDRIITLSEGRDGSLWLATEQLELVRSRAGRFTKLAFEQGTPRELVATLLVDSAGTVWVGTTQGVWALRGDRLVPVARETVQGHVWSMVQRRDGTLWVGTMGTGIFRVTSDGRATKLAVDPALQADSISRIYEDADGVLPRSVW